MSADQPVARLDVGALDGAWQQGQVVLLAPPQLASSQAASAQPRPAALQALAASWGPGVVVGSGGSTGGRRWCFQPLSNLQASAAATAAWLQAQGMDPASCLHLNPLPLHHVSGLMPLVRSRSWGAQHQGLPAELLRQPHLLAEAAPLPPGKPALLSLVPTQLARLLADVGARAWLRQLAVVWVGGAALPDDLAQLARQEEIRLAPCYGATETAAMVCALTPERFLAGDGGCGQPLVDVAVRIDPLTGAVEVATDRLSPGWIGAGVANGGDGLEPLPRTADGWWRSGDGGLLGPAGLEILGRLDGAILSGGETVFPEQLEQRLRLLVKREGWPLKELLLLGVAEPGWGERLTALLRPEPGADGTALIRSLELAVMAWPPAERPRRWLLCEPLAPSPSGKWERHHWQQWLQAQSANQRPGS